MRVFGIVGWKDSGKTTLIARLVEKLTASGVRVSTLKHAHHDFDVDQPGKDSFRHREAGAVETLIASERRWALMHELRSEPEPPFGYLLQRLSPVDLVLVEGYKTENHWKLEVRRQHIGGDLICENDTTVVAIATDESDLRASVPVLDLNDVGVVADFILNRIMAETAE